MKKKFLFLFFFFFIAVQYSHAQVAINEDSSAADPSAILDLKSSTKGLLLPRMKDVSTNPIASPKAGLLVYDSTTKTTWVYNGTAWVKQGSFSLPFADSLASSGSSLFQIKDLSASSGTPTIYGISSSTSMGSTTSGATAIQGELTATSGGSYSTAVRGINRSTTGLGIGVVGYQAGSGWGVYGNTPSGVGVYGFSNTGMGLFGSSNSGTAAYLSSSGGIALKTYGKIQLTNIGEGAGKVLTSDASGNASWQAPAVNNKVSFLASPTNNVPVAAYSSASLTSYRTPDFNDGNGFNNTTGAFTAPSSGLYHFDVMINFSSQSGDISNASYYVRLLINGSIQNQVSTTVSLINFYANSLTLSYNVKLAANDQVAILFYNGSGQTIQVNSNGSVADTYFSGYQVY